MIELYTGKTELKKKTEKHHFGRMDGRMNTRYKKRTREDKGKEGNKTIDISTRRTGPALTGLPQIPTPKPHSLSEQLQRDFVRGMPLPSPHRYTA